MKKITSKEALQIIENLRGKGQYDGWIDHSKCVGETAGIIARKLDLDVDKAQTMGLLHDIGRGNVVVGFHPIDGYNYVKSLGIEDEYANNCLTHSYLNNDVDCNAGAAPTDIFLINFIKNHKYTIYEKIINLCDLMCKTERMTMEERLVDLLQRHGVFNTTPYHLTEALKLKKEFDEMLGCNLYSLFPDILENITKFK